MIFGYWVRGESHIEMLKMSIASVRAMDPHANIMVCSNTPIDYPSPYLLHDRTDLPPMAANIDAQFRMAVEAKGERLLFLDADTLVRYLPTEFSAYLGDIGATWRDHVGRKPDGTKIEGDAKAMPYNYGVLYASGRSGSIEALLWMRERVMRMKPELRAWYGNQMALVDLLGPNVRGFCNGTLDTVRTIRWDIGEIGTQINVSGMPCERFNYTPESEHEDVSEKYILHFKGGRKDMMRSYANRMGLEA